MEIFEGAGLVEEAMKEAASLDLTNNNIEKPMSKFHPHTSILDKQPVLDFLKGKNCLSGGSGWWKYELCYGSYVRQYHIDKNGEQSLVLGAFNADAHIEWLQKNPHKRPLPIGSRTELIHFYTDGTLCDKTGKPRQTEVRLKCPEKSSSLSSVTLYLLEPKTCEYELTVQSSLICDILDLADKNGLVSDTLDSIYNKSNEDLNKAIDD